MARGMKDPDPPPEVTEAAASSVAMGESKNETAGMDHRGGAVEVSVVKHGQTGINWMK